MIKYEVRKQSHIETTKGPTDWSADDMIKYFNSLSWTALELVDKFDTIEKAKECFDDEKRYCQSCYQKGSSSMLVMFDYLVFMETEYDENGEFIQGDYIDEFVAEVQK